MQQAALVAKTQLDQVIVQAVAHLARATQRRGDSEPRRRSCAAPMTSSAARRMNDFFRLVVQAAVHYLQEMTAAGLAVRGLMVTPR